jgi:hypothetical protein
MRNIDNNVPRKRNSYKFDYVKSYLLLYNRLAVRSFFSTPHRRGDPLSITITAFGSPYASSLLANPLAGGFIILLGMTTSLLFSVIDLPAFFM